MVATKPEGEGGTIFSAQNSTYLSLSLPWKLRVTRGDELNGLTAKIRILASSVHGNFRGRREFYFYRLLFRVANF